ncbi:MAG: hypothetical protein QF752_01640 [Planctomycetota bacterium]|jgi:hypothetical protein|nr:hypothetical protein [Planctomycetota bacterium]
MKPDQTITILYLTLIGLMGLVVMVRRIRGVQAHSGKDLLKTGVFLFRWIVIMVVSPSSHPPRKSYNSRASFGMQSLVKGWSIDFRRLV